MRIAFCAVLLAVGMSYGQTVEMPKSVEVAPGRLATVTIKYDGDDIKWIVGSKLDLFREFDPDPKLIKLRVIGYETGEFNLVAIACKGGKLSDFAVCKIEIKGPQPPTPPSPGPGPTPTPDSPFVADLKKAILADGATAAEVKAMAENYKTASSFTGAFSGKLGGLFSQIRDIVKVDKLDATKKAVNGYLAKAGLPADAQADLTPEQIRLIAKVLLEIALALLEATK